MDKKKLDRRIQRTRKLLIDALVSLILEKGYNKITVQNIIDRANVGRSTFYAHFQDKEQLLASSFGNLANDLSHHVESDYHSDDSQHHIVHSFIFFHHAYANQDFYRAMAESGGGDIFLEIGRQHIQQSIETHMESLLMNREELSIPLPVITNFLAGTLLSMITWCIANDFPHTPEEINTMYNALTLPGFWQVLGISPP